MKPHFVFIIVVIVGLLYWRLSRPPTSSALDINTNDAIEMSTEPLELLQSQIPRHHEPLALSPSTPIAESETQNNHPQLILEKSDAKGVRSKQLPLPGRVRSFSDLSKMMQTVQFSSLEGLLSGLTELNEFRAGANESIWNGNYFGSLGWSDEIPDGKLKSWPGVINLEFKRPDESSPLTCLGILKNQILLRFTKGTGNFVPMSAQNKNNYFVFRINPTHYLQVLLSDDAQGLAATLYIQDPSLSLKAVSSGVFSKNNAPTDSEVSCSVD